MQKVLVTGVTGFVGKHVALKFLAAGYQVLGTVRRLDRAEEVRTALRPHLSAEAMARLCFVQADLLADEAWAAAMVNTAAVVHVASPFVIGTPENEVMLNRTMVEGTLRVMRMAKAGGVRRFILTSSMAAVLDPDRSGLATEGDWADPSAASATAFVRGKVQAERAAWDFAGREGMALTVINPGLVLGPPLDAHYGESVGVVKRLLACRDPAVPLLGLALADVRDVAEMHLRAVQRPKSAGKRYLGVSGSVTLPDMARMLKRIYPRRRIATIIAPRWLVRLYQMWDPQIAAVLPMLGYIPAVSNALACSELGMEFRTPTDAVQATADWLVRAGQV